jgi:hypothetical protein
MKLERRPRKFSRYHPTPPKKERKSKSQIAQGNPEQKYQCYLYIILHFNLYYVTIVTKTVWYWHKKRYVDE